LSQKCHRENWKSVSFFGLMWLRLNLIFPVLGENCGSVLKNGC